MFQGGKMVEIASCGNVALVHGFLTFGLEASRPGSPVVLFGAGYPITPVNEIAQWGMEELPPYGGEFIQAESELAAINMVLGAACLGKPAFTATSSPGMSLMQEALSYAIGMEVPFVVADIVRGGPGLGNIQGAQSDLKLALSAGHGDFSPIVWAPASCQEMYDFGRLAFEYAYRYQVPGFILTDGYIGQLREKYRMPDSIRPRPQADSRRLRSSIYVRESVLTAHNWKLFRRFERMRQDASLQQLAIHEYETEAKGVPADILILSYGIFSRIGFGVVERARREGLSVGQASLKVLSPFPQEQLRALARRHKALYVLEGSCGQLHEKVREAVGQVPLVGLTAYPGGDLPCEAEVVENLRRFSEQLSPEYLGWKTEALALEDKVRRLQSRIAPNRGATYEQIPLDEATYPYEIQGNRKARHPRSNPIMTDVPFSYCVGCGETTAVASIAKVLARLPQFDKVLYSPVGCSIFLYDYFKEEFVRNVQVPHGRSSASASASKRVEPEKLHISIQGDGDALDIGFSELIHTMERGENITIVLFNNGTYGMTGGQVSSSTPLGEYSATTQQGRDPKRHGAPLDLAQFIAQPGVAYFRRALLGSQEEIQAFENALANALYHQMAGHGVSIVEIFTACPGRQKPSKAFVEAMAQQGVKAKGKVPASLQYAARVLPPGADAMNVRRGDDVEDPYGELEEIHREMETAGRERGIAAEERYTRCLEILSRRYGLQRAAEHPVASLSDLRIYLGGLGGQGVQSLAEALVKALSAVYANFTNSPWYEPEVTKALTTSSLTFTNREQINPILQPGEVDLVVAMKKRIVEEKLAMIRPEGLLVYDCDEGKLPEEIATCRFVQVAASSTARKTIGDLRCANAVLFGVLAQLLEGVDLEVAREIVRRSFPAPQINLQALEAGIALMESTTPVG